jgi:hypothetical protein
MLATENCIATALVDKAQPVIDALRERSLSVTAQPCTAGLIFAILSQAQVASW